MVAPRPPVPLECRDDAAGDPVVGGEHAVELRAAAVRRGEQILHALLRGLLLPAQDRRLLDIGLPRRHRQHALVDVGLQRVHRPLPEEVGVVVVERAGEELDVERALLSGVLAVLIEHAEADQQ